MTDKIVIEAQKRDVFGKKLASLREQGLIPAVVYGSGKPAEPISINSVDFNKTYNKVGHSSIVEIKIDGAGTKNVLIHDVQLNPMLRTPIHADFYLVKMDEVIRTSVPLHFTGESTAVFQDNGSLLTALQELEVECLPGNLPASIEVDIAGLDDFEKTITVADITLPEGVKVLDEAEELVAKVEAPRSEEELEALDEEIVENIPAEEGEAAEATADSGSDAAKAEDKESSK